MQAIERRRAETRHSEIRATAAAEASDSIFVELGITVGFRPINDSDVALADRWTFNGQAPGWSWAKEVKKLRTRTCRLEAAITFNPPHGELCGLLLGRISDGRVIASLHYLHRAPNPNPLSGQIALIALRYLEFCAVAYSCTTMRLRDPLPAVVPVYTQLGFAPGSLKKGKIKWLERDVL